MSPNLKELIRSRWVDATELSNMVWCPQPCSITPQRSGSGCCRPLDITASAVPSLIWLLLGSVDSCADPSDTEPGGSRAQPDQPSRCFHQGEDRELAKTDKVQHEGNRWWNVWQPDRFIPHWIQSQSEFVYGKTMKGSLILNQSTGRVNGIITVHQAQGRF